MQVPASTKYSKALHLWIWPEKHISADALLVPVLFDDAVQRRGQLKLQHTPGRLHQHPQLHLQPTDAQACGYAYRYVQNALLMQSHCMRLYLQTGRANRLLTQPWHVCSYDMHTEYACRICKVRITKFNLHSHLPYHQGKVAVATQGYFDTMRLTPNEASEMTGPACSAIACVATAARACLLLGAGAAESARERAAGRGRLCVQQPQQRHHIVAQELAQLIFRQRRLIALRVSRHNTMSSSITAASR